MDTPVEGDHVKGEPPKGSHPSPLEGDPCPRRQRDTCENTTFRQLRLLAVKKPMSPTLRITRKLEWLLIELMHLYIRLNDDKEWQDACSRTDLVQISLL